MKKLLLGMALALPMASNAGIINLNFNQSACETAVGGGTATAVCNQINSDLDAAINEDLPDTNFNGYAEGISNAVAIAGAGATDYSDKFTYFVVKPSLGVGVAAESISDTETAGGIGFTGNMVIGLNMDLLPVDKIGPIELDKLDVFVNVYSHNVDQDAGDDGTFEGEVGSFGIMARYHLIEEAGASWLGQWGGVYLHTGFQRTTMDLKFSTPIDITDDIDVSGNTANIQNANARFEMESAITTIPIEASTYLRFLYVFTLYGGLGMDINMGSTDVNLISSGDMILTSAGNANLGNIGINDKNSGEPESLGFRGFAGLQLNIPFVRLYAQFQKALGTDAVGTNFGVKVLW
jgi:hypothetical protein